LEKLIKNTIHAREERGTERHISNILLVPQPTFHKYLNLMGQIRTNTRLKPKLTELQLMNRLKFVLSRVDSRTNNFFNFDYDVHLDESWFYLREDSEWIRYFPGEEIPEPLTVNHRSHIPKVMFLTVLACPQLKFDFDGIIGIYRVCEKSIAIRNSKFKIRGEEYDIDCNCTASWYNNCMLGENGIMSTIRKKMFFVGNGTINIQHDGATTHNGKGNLEAFTVEGQSSYPLLNIITQPSNSPDLNINDLGFFPSIKSKVSEINLWKYR
jgi:hypothetical protein